MVCSHQSPQALRLLLQELGEQATVRQFQPASRSPLGIRSLNYDQVSSEQCQNYAGQPCLHWRKPELARRLQDSQFPQQSKGLKSRVMDFLMGA